MFSGRIYVVVIDVAIAAAAVDQTVVVAPGAVALGVEVGQKGVEVAQKSVEVV
jgi:hypothetical protein